MAYDFSNFLNGIGSSPEDEYQKMLAQTQQAPVSRTLLSPQNSAQQLAFGGGAESTAQAMQSQAANQLNESMAAKNAVANQRDAQMQSTQAQASQAAQQAQAEQEQKKAMLTKLATMYFTGGLGGGAAAGATGAAASAVPINILNHYDKFF